LRSTRFCFRCAISTGVGDVFTGGQSRERFQSNVNSDGIPKCGEWLGLALHQKTRIPLLAFALHRDGLDLAAYGAVQLDLDFPYPSHAKMLFQKFIAIPMARESDAVVPSCPFTDWSKVIPKMGTTD
jgi:hypothetical protein